MNEILEAGLTIPRDIAIIGCGNSHYDDTLRVPLTSIDQNSRRIGEKTGKLLLNMLDPKSTPRIRKAIIAPELVERASTTRKQKGISK